MKHKARADHGLAKAEVACEEKEKNEETLAELYTKRDLIQNEISDTHYQTKLAHESIAEAQKTATARNKIA